MIDRARQTFDAMPAIERWNLACLGYWLSPDRERQEGGHLLGPEYEALRLRGVIDNSTVSVAEGKPVRLTDLGSAVLQLEWI